VELRDFATQVLFSESLEAKLLGPDGDFTDFHPGEAVRTAAPGRPANLRFSRRGAKMPKAVHEPRLRAIAHHIMANHELQALEVMAWVLLAFPEAPTEFRLGMAVVMRDEQRHTQMHVRRARELGLEFGDKAVNSYVWKKGIQAESLLDYIACLPLTFEGGNLDHSLEFAAMFERAGDAKSAAVMRKIHHDEIEHVAFGVKWLRLLKPAGASDWDVFRSLQKPPLRPEDAVGCPFHREPRLEAGLSPEFVDQLEAAYRQLAAGEIEKEGPPRGGSRSS
jgi:uncharacterized ferritin-like protein (DUF455 family)